MYEITSNLSHPPPASTTISLGDERNTSSPNSATSSTNVTHSPNICCISGCKKPSSIRNFSCLKGFPIGYAFFQNHSLCFTFYRSNWKLKTNVLHMKICTSHYNEDLRLYPRESLSTTPSSSSTPHVSLPTPTPPPTADSQPPAQQSPTEQKIMNKRKRQAQDDSYENHQNNTEDSTPSSSFSEEDWQLIQSYKKRMKRENAKRIEIESKKELLYEIHEISEREKRLARQKQKISIHDETQDERFIPNISISFDLSMEPCIRYNLTLFHSAHCSSEMVSPIPERLKNEVLYLESCTQRFQLCTFDSIHYQWSLVLNPLFYNSDEMKQTNVPLPNEAVKILFDGLQWTDLEWGTDSVIIKKEHKFPLFRMRFYPKHSTTVVETTLQ